MPSIQHRGGFVKKAMDALLEGYDVKGDSMGLQEIGSLSVNETVEVFHALLKAGKDVSVSTRFRIGDMYNLLGEKHRVARRKAMQDIMERFSDNDRQMFRTCGWVAHKWPRGKRSTEYGWTYYLRNNPDEPARVIEKPLPMYEAVESQSMGSAYILECVGKAGKRFIVKVNKSLVEPFRSETSEKPQGQVPASA